MGNISNNFGQFIRLQYCNGEIKQLEAEMNKLDKQEDFGKYMKRWQEAHKLKAKILDCCDRLLWGVYKSLNQFHNAHKLVHLDVKGYQCKIQCVKAIQIFYRL